MGAFPCSAFSWLKWILVPKSAKLLKSATEKHDSNFFKKFGCEHTNAPIIARADGGHHILVLEPTTCVLRP